MTLRNAFADLATEVTLASVDTKTPPITGTWGYNAGVSGTVTLAGSKRVRSITAISTAGGTVTIDGGDSIPIPANFAFNLPIDAQITDAVIVFTGTDSYFVDYVS